MKNIFLCAFIIFFAGCTALDMKRPVSENYLRDADRIAVVSLLGDWFQMIHIGTTIFNNEQYPQKVNWSVDEYAEKEAVRLLSGNSGLKVFSLLRPSRNAEDYYKYGSSTQVDYEKLIGLSKAQGATSLVVIRRSQYDNAPFHIGGYGFFERSAFGMTSKCAYALFIVDVFDVKTGKKMAWEWGKPCLSGDEGLAWKKPFSSYSTEEQALLRSRVLSQIRSNLETAFREVGVSGS